MNQRRGNWHSAAMNDSDSQGLKMASFFRDAKEALEKQGHDDAAFYFEQCEDWIRSGKSLSSKPASYILGV